MGITIFISYALRDIEWFKISELKKYLKRQPEVDYIRCQETETDQVFSETLESKMCECEIMLLFYSRYYFTSKLCTKELQLAKMMHLDIMRIFSRFTDIPPSLQDYLNFIYYLFFFKIWSQFEDLWEIIRFLWNIPKKSV